MMQKWENRTVKILLTERCVLDIQWRKEMGGIYIHL